MLRRQPGTWRPGQLRTSVKQRQQGGGGAGSCSWGTQTHLGGREGMAQKLCSKLLSAVGLYFYALYAPGKI